LSAEEVLAVLPGKSYRNQLEIPRSNLRRPMNPIKGFALTVRVVAICFSRPLTTGAVTLATMD